MKLHIYGALKEYKKRRPARMHMPGHKANRRRFPLFKDAALDITELSFSDCLESPDGIIAKAQQDIADVLGAKRSYILTDGSTCGVFAMLYCVKAAGGKVVIARNSHKSVYNACAVLGIEPILLKNNELDGVLLPPTAADIEAVLNKEKDACAVLVTSPDYYGNIADYAAIRRVCTRYEKIFMVDGAHGAYLRFDPDENADYAGRYADIWVDGAHKTLPALTQGALLNLNDESLRTAAEEGLNIFRTTSPSYPVMASVEYGVKYLEDNGAQLIDAVKRELALCRAKLKKRGIGVYEGSRTLVLAADLASAGISPDLAQERLEHAGIFAEMNDGRYLLFYFSPLTPPAQIARLARRLSVLLRMRSLKTESISAREYVCGVKKFGYLTAQSLPFEYVPLTQAAGRVAARGAGITPPCYPVVVAGEQITAEAAQALAQAKHTFGIKNGKIAVLHIGGRA